MTLTNSRQFSQLLCISFFIIIVLVGCSKPENPGITTNATITVLDWDSRLPITGAMVRTAVAPGFIRSVDSALTNSNGQVSFIFQNNDIYLMLAEKPGYQLRYGSYLPAASINGLTLYMMKNSYLDMNTLRTGTYNSTDSLKVKVETYWIGDQFLIGITKGEVFRLSRLANASDTALTIPLLYFVPPYHKAFITWDIERNGSVILHGTDSTSLIQYGHQNYSVNY